MVVLSVSRCPHCNKMINSEVNPTYSWVKEENKAPDVFMCPKCGGYISSGESEWIDKSASERRSFILKKAFTTIVTAIFIGFALTMMGLFLFEKYFGIKLNLFVFIALFIFFGGGILAWNYLGIRREIRNSLERTQNRVK